MIYEVELLKTPTKRTDAQNETVKEIVKGRNGVEGQKAFEKTFRMVEGNYLISCVEITNKKSAYWEIYLVDKEGLATLALTRIYSRRLDLEGELNITGLKCKLTDKKIIVKILMKGDDGETWSDDISFLIS